MTALVTAQDLVERFRAALSANAAEGHGPFPVEEAVEVALRLAVGRAGGRPVAVATGDPLLAPLDLRSRLAAAGADVLVPPPPTSAGPWSAALARAGTGVTGSVFGLAATGTVGVTCGPDAPRAVSLVPPAHVCLLRTGDLVEDLAEALGRITALPSALVWISGPSRSADLEMTLTLGVHGPASLDVVLIEDHPQVNALADK